MNPQNTHRPPTGHYIPGDTVRPTGRTEHVPLAVSVVPVASAVIREITPHNLLDDRQVQFFLA